MGDKDEIASRRKVLRTISGSAAAVAVGTGTVTADPDRDNLDVLDVNKVQKVLDMVGDPTIQQKVVDTLPGTEKQKIKLETEIGILSYVDFHDVDTDENMALRFEFNDLKSITANRLPDRYQSAPNESELLLMVDGSDDILTRRSLTEEENDYIYSLIGNQYKLKSDKIENISSVYCDKLGGVYFNIISEKTRVEFLIIQEEEKSITNPATNLDSDNLNIMRHGDTVPSKSVRPAQSDPSCGGLVFHPCGQCTAGTALCGACAPTCVGSFGVTCGACILECGYTTDTCCKCLHCIDGIPDDQIDRKCPSDLEDDAVDKGGDILDDATDAIGGLL
ncbi:hypothetical protein [Natrinema sp. H-ect4]|uniref:hypothetical protein n=1 Tax=Natrinema sp. H-ect4 TaxID=3242699 RepID=UPI0035A98F08